MSAILKTMTLLDVHQKLEAIIELFSFGKLSKPKYWKRFYGMLQLKLRLPICEIWCEIYQLFRSLVYFILPFTDIQNFSDRK